jgi:hypothetical protein
MGFIWDTSNSLGDYNTFSGSKKSYANVFGSNKEGKMAVDPFTVGVAGAFSLANGLIGADAQNKSIGLQMDMAARAQEFQERAMATNALQQRWGAIEVPAWQQYLQGNAALKQQNIFDPKQMALESDRYGFNLKNELSPDALKYTQKKNRDTLENAIKAQGAAAERHFGYSTPSPFAFSNPSYSVG